MPVGTWPPKGSCVGESWDHERRERYVSSLACLGLLGLGSEMLVAASTMKVLPRIEARAEHICTRFYLEFAHAMSGHPQRGMFRKFPWSGFQYTYPRIPGPDSWWQSHFPKKEAKSTSRGTRTRSGVGVKEGPGRLYGKLLEELHDMERDSYMINEDLQKSRRRSRRRRRRGDPEMIYSPSLYELLFRIYRQRAWVFLDEFRLFASGVDAFPGIHDLALKDRAARQKRWDMDSVTMRRNARPTKDPVLNRLMSTPWKCSTRFWSIRGGPEEDYEGVGSGASTDTEKGLCMHGGHLRLPAKFLRALWTLTMSSWPSASALGGRLIPRTSKAGT